MRVLTSKQRPRKLNLRASNGKDYPFLLKGHEDLRQDERVMQLFSLVNALISSDRLTSKKDLHIRGYAVVPLSPSSGLIEWLGQCDTLNDLIQEYRNRKRILVELERLIMMNSAPEKQLQSLTVIQMVDVLEQAQMATKGQDIQAMLWLKSQNSEIWLDRRTNYIRSLAAMSMVGYILGLGDRHPCNLMLDRTTGKIIHIDFGDCFEVACLREKFPEKVPFRLTRMLINAMEVSGIEGSFRRTCENVLRVLRENKESVLAVLEAFIHDPLISWRLLNTDNDQLSLDLDVGFYNDSGEMENQKKGNKVMSSFSAQGSAVEEDSDSLNESALHAMNRVKEKLTGRDFEGETLDIQKQVSKLILQATAPENLAQCWIGWCPFW
jgi:FKBP12-rapamycin complex-associated protein